MQLKAAQPDAAAACATRAHAPPPPAPGWRPVHAAVVRGAPYAHLQAHALIKAASQSPEATGSAKAGFEVDLPFDERLARAHDLPTESSERTPGSSRGARLQSMAVPHTALDCEDLAAIHARRVRVAGQPSACVCLLPPPRLRQFAPQSTRECGHTDLACSASISTRSWSCSLSYAALSGRPSATSATCARRPEVSCLFPARSRCYKDARRPSSRRWSRRGRRPWTTGVGARRRASWRARSTSCSARWGRRRRPS